MEHFGKTVRANQRCAEEEVSAVLSGVEVASVDDSMFREDAATHLTSLVSRLQVPRGPFLSSLPGCLQRQDQAPPRDPAGARPDLGPRRQVPPVVPPVVPFLSPLSPDVYSDKIKHLLEPPPEHGRVRFH
ncbi:hypothetical protein ACMD2_21883 [Ananas comosus]|uniref:Uncharacterized protein n=1 Tax=Ananas comosus TaxID=4615 RepID=A0A199VJQ7_ANACO|nr:hypothetical protein ACMD2_21883 [Ananas comosus]